MPEKPSVTLPGTVDKVIPSLSAHQADTVQISVQTPHNLYREVRIENTLTSESGGKVSPQTWFARRGHYHCGGRVDNGPI
jgi:hypothetical protein